MQVGLEAAEVPSAVLRRRVLLLRWLFVMMSASEGAVLLAQFLVSARPLLLVLAVEVPSALCLPRRVLLLPPLLPLLPESHAQGAANYSAGSRGYPGLPDLLAMVEEEVEALF